MEEDEEEEGISVDSMGYHDAAAQNLVSKIRAFPLVTTHQYYRSPGYARDAAVNGDGNKSEWDKELFYYTATPLRNYTHPALGG